MDIKKCVLEAMEEISGIPEDDLLDNMEYNLKDEGILDSVSCAALVMELEERLHQPIDMTKMNMSDFSTINAIIFAINNQIK